MYLASNIDICEMWDFNDVNKTLDKIDFNIFADENNHGDARVQVGAPFNIFFIQRGKTL